MTTHETESIIVTHHGSKEPQAPDILDKIDIALAHPLDNKPEQEELPSDRALWGAAAAYTEERSTIFPPADNPLPLRREALSSDAVEWYMRPDSEEREVVPPKRNYSLGGLELTVSPAEAPIIINEGPEGVTARIDMMPEPGNIIIPHLIVTRGELSQKPSKLLIEGPGKVILLTRDGVSADADRPERTRANTMVHSLPGSDVRRPKYKAA